jgi:hypothetical protein
VPTTRDKPAKLFPVSEIARDIRRCFHPARENDGGAGPMKIPNFR